MKTSYIISLIAVALISTAGASFNNILRTSLEIFLTNVFGMESKLLEDVIIFFFFLIVLIILGLGFKSVLKRIVAK